MPPSTHGLGGRVTHPEKGYLRIVQPSRWVTRFGAGLQPGARVLDLACGNARHARWFLARGHLVTLVDIDIAPVADLAARADVEVIAGDLEAGGGDWPLSGRAFGAICVVNYLHRPLFPDIVAALAAGGLLLYETFAEGNETVRCRPTKPEHLLKPDELLTLAAAHGLFVAAFEQGLVADECGLGVKQRLAAVKGPVDHRQPIALYP